MLNKLFYCLKTDVSLCHIVPQLLGNVALGVPRKAKCGKMAGCQLFRELHKIGSPEEGS